MKKVGVLQRGRAASACSHSNGILENLGRQAKIQLKKIVFFWGISLCYAFCPTWVIGMGKQRVKIFYS